MSQGYTQTILLDANRLSSEEYSASNLAQTDNAVFTNKVSNGITIDIGDQVSIQSAHISQRGAGGEVIQMNGNELGEKSITTTHTVNSSFIGFLKQAVLGLTYSPTGYLYETSSNISEKVKMKDNEASIVISYYKNTNGENNIPLPRNFGSASMGSSVHGGDPTGGSVTNALFWSASDSFAKGLNTYPITASHTYLPDYQGVDAMNSCGTSCKCWKLKQDNSKYTIFKRSEIIWKYDGISSASRVAYLQPVPTKPDPAIGNYNRLLQKVVLNVPIGYNSPSTIASDITDQLIKTEDEINIIDERGTSFINSTLYKATPCASVSTFSASGCREFFNSSLNDHLPISVGTNACDTEKAIDYLSSYSHIGFKRPDFVESGREVGAYHGNLLKTAINLGDREQAIIYTNYSWNDATLTKLKRFFDSQRLYPELLEHATTSGNSSYSAIYPTANASDLNSSFIKEARFLHLDIQSHTKSPTEALGDDMYNVSYTSNNFIPPRTNASDKSSIPLFFYFNENCSNLTASQTVGDTNENLAYGFARKWISGGSELVALLTEPIGGIPISYFGEHIGGNIISANTKIGYDYHFNAYGNSAIMLHNGFNYLQYYGQIEYDEGPLIKQMYLGANNTLLNFDGVQNRFEISNLHSPEKVGNFYTAGDPNPSADIFAPPPSDQASQDCIKINKQLKYDTWSPSMQPYTVIDLSGSATTNTQKTFIPTNSNLSTGIIYDAHGGISIEDMGIDEKYWSQSIWGLLGFEYGQFNASGENIKNINIRFTNENDNTSGVTTNADLTSQVSQQFHSNPYSTNMFNSLLNSQVLFYNNPQSLKTFSTVAASHTVNPSVVIASDSTKIIANNLPRKILRGYFLINSDILDSANYYQLANPLQTMAVVGKYNAASDFVNYDGGGPVFTATRKKTITSIKTQILDPEGNLAQVGDNSGIIYRIDKQINTDLHFAENLLSGQYGKPPK